MSVKLTRRTASLIMRRGINSVRIKPSAVEEAKKAITREDVKALIKGGNIYTIKEKHNISRYGKELKLKRAEGRKRGRGKKKGTRGARNPIEYPKRVRAQRRIIASLKADGTIGNDLYKSFYALVKGGTFQTKVSLLNHIKSKGVKIDDERFKKLKHL